MAYKKQMKVEVYGLLTDINFVRAKCCAEDLYNCCSSVFQEPYVEGMLEFEWDLYIDAKRKELRGETWQFGEKAIIFIDTKMIGGTNDFMLWAQDNFYFYDFRPVALYTILTEEGYKTHLNSKKHDYVYMDINIGDQPAGRLVIELFSDIVPRASANFKALCTGEKGKSVESDYMLHYKNSLFHRIVENSWIQGGDFYHSRGNGGGTIFEDVFEDESFEKQYKRRGMLGMVNQGQHTNVSQFFITLQPNTWKHTKYVCFGQVIEGTETLKKMEGQTTMNERPNTEIRITNCNVWRYEL